MDIVMRKGCDKYLIDCEIALLNSTLGRKYFSKEGNAKEAIKEGLATGNFFVAINGEECIGFFWYLPKGAFHCYPFLHIVAVKEQYRGNGIGKKILKHFEEIAFKDSDKTFLVVAEFNPESKVLYEKIGYRQVGEIPSLYRNGITEYLMMKCKEK